MKPVGYAFWPYDLFPYILGAEFTKLKGKQALVPSFGANAWVTPLFVLGVKEGRELLQNLDGLRSLRQNAIEEINAKFREELQTIVREAGGKLKHSN